MKLLGLVIGLFLFAGAAHAEVFFEDRMDVFKIPVSRSTEWVVTFGSSELEPRGVIYEVNTLTGDKKELYAFGDQAFFEKTAGGNYVFTAEGEYSVTIIFFSQYKSDRFTAKIKFSGKNAPFEGVAQIEDCEKFPNVK